ncbi:RHS repeat-associated core domain-containing protein [Providencia rettgeri]|uniref:RHS repeat-associated core domain-containing protein n=1 Tax=Providencia rettgeri TaxID=587 RepID=UPI0023606190|nr:RHS repeat-associated core domain-containing protein [Providencia rettgeri]
MKTSVNLSFHAGTPTIQVVDNRGLVIRHLQYYREPDLPDELDERATLQELNIQGYLVSLADPRLALSKISNMDCLYNLNGETLRTHGVDVGISVALNDIEGRLLFSIDANETRRTCQYEANTTLGRPVSIMEKTKNGIPYTSEYFIYAGFSTTEQQANLAGACVHHYDPAGLLILSQVSLQGKPLLTTRQFIQQIEEKETLANWENYEQKEKLETEEYHHQIQVDATGSPLQSIDGKGHQQRYAYNITGQLKQHWLTINGQKEQPAIKSIEYLATSQKQQEEHGNGVLTYYEYEPQTQRLLRVKTQRPNTHPLGFKLFQDVYYEYDPVGNRVSMRNEAEKTYFWRNQKIIPEQRYQYDSLYQLVSATGREMANIGQQDHQIANYVPFDNATYTQYIRRYVYDRGGNLTRIHHRSPATNQSYVTQMTVSQKSNRAVIAPLTIEPSQTDDFFTLGGQQKQLLQGQHLHWTPRQELQYVSSSSLYEHYRYDSASQRVFKISHQAHCCKQTRYLTGLDIKSIQRNGITKECLQVVSVGENGNTQVTVLHWESRIPEGIKNNLWRFHFDFLAGNGGLELDEEGHILTQEEFYPYGGTAVWLARNQVEADYKTRRYSGKERDATGLYYYGYRYYQPWAGRWLSADPAGTADGLNFYRMSRNNPINYIDPDGLFPFHLLNPLHWVSAISRRREERKAAENADYSYIFMANGRYWNNRFHDKASFDRVTRTNIEYLRKVTSPLNEMESSFVERFTKLNFTLLHASKTDFRVNSEVTFKSRVKLRSTDIIDYAHDHTSYSDEMNLQTKEFAFFSLGIEGAEGKNISRFGDKLYSTPLNSVENERYIPYSHVSINDTLRYSTRQFSARLGRLFGRDDGNLLKEEVIAGEASETVYAYSNFKEAIALRMLNSARLISQGGYNRIINTQSNQEFDTLMSLLFRPQLLVPRELKSKNTTIRTIQHKPELMGTC